MASGDDLLSQRLLDATVGDTFRNLVRQFSDPLCCFRELVQNAIDAGTDRVDIWFEHADEPGMDCPLGTIHVRDVGEGMDRRIIEDELTCLFASSKAGDYTKVGKFGIGFVSVFALAPTSVTVDTARHGEAWRLRFQPSGAYELVPLLQPMEGTHVRIVRAMEASFWKQFVEQAAAAVTRWCRHSPIPVYVEGRLISTPMAIVSPVQVRWEGPGTTIVAGLSPTRFFGFYRGGITIFEGDVPGLEATPVTEGIALKISSRLLEPTLSRDAVKIDGDFHKAMDLALKVIDDQLVDEVYRTLEKTGDDYLSLVALAHPLLVRTIRQTGRQVRCLRTRDGAVSWEDLMTSQARMQSEGPLFVTDPALAAVLPGTPALAAQPGDPLWNLLVALGVVPADDRLLAVCRVEVHDAALQRLLDDAGRLLRKSGLKLHGWGWGRWRGDSPCVAASGPRPTVVDRAGPWPQKPWWLVHAEHPWVAHLKTLSQSDAKMAAFLLARSACPGEAIEARLMAEASRG
ncbi:MAG TPA: ATP-binding protein [Candidatus Xenobia bacterium]|jgi:hypothetical protein